MAKKSKFNFSKIAKLFGKNATLILLGFLMGIGGIALANSSDIVNKAKEIIADTTLENNEDVIKNINSGEAAVEAPTTDSSIPSVNKSNREHEDKENPKEERNPECVFYEYTGAELTTGVKGRIGQYAYFNDGGVDKSGYIRAVRYSEYSNGQKYNIKYDFEKGPDFIPEESLYSVTGKSGFYKIDGQPILSSDRPSYCP